ncbi:MAG: hypothetical protein ACM36C_04710, partial [Acidobacteriota bacterium]
RYSSAQAQLVVVSRLRGSGTVTVPGLPAHAPVILTSEDDPFVAGGQVPEVDGDEVTFAVPSTIVFAVTR